MTVSDSTAILLMARDCWESIGGVVKAFAHSAGAPQKLCFGIWVDDDDERTIEAVERLQRHPLYRIGLFKGRGRPKYWGAYINEMAQAFGEHVDYFHVVNDDNFPLCHEWDLHFWAFMQRHPETLMASWCPEPTKRTADGLPLYAADYLMVTRKWVEAAGEIFPERYPFWFMDFSLGQVHRMVTGHPIRAVCNKDDATPVKLCALKVGATKRFRDYEFWRDYFVALEPERVALARRICAALGLEGHIKPTVRAKLWEETRAVLFDDPDMAGRIARLSDPSPPDARYLEAKAEAEAHMASLKEAA